jgi:methionyl-tRNA formyltransferase
MAVPPFRILFAGNPELSVKTLEALHSNFCVVGVLTHPDKIAKRGKKLEMMPVKEFALQNNIPVVESDKLTGAVREQVSHLEPNLLISFATSHYFGPKFLSLFSMGAFNVHPSLLPLHRGSAPLQFAILHKDDKTGISIQHIVKEIDSGDILNQIEFSLSGNETTESLSNKVAPLAADLVVETFLNFETYVANQSTQDHSQATFTRMLTKEDGLIDWEKPAADIDAQIRAMYPWPKAYTSFLGTPLIIAQVASLSEESNDHYIPGTVVAFEKKKGLKIACADSFIYISRLQLSKKKEMDSASFINGNPQIINTKLGT